jgi:hypothetical protein
MTVSEIDLDVTDADVAIAGLCQVSSSGVGELWVRAHGLRVCALSNARVAWLMVLRDDEGDPGFSSRNPSYAGARDARETFVLGNGQTDEYPAQYCFPRNFVFRALEAFVLTGRFPEEIRWFNDSGDGALRPETA